MTNPFALAIKTLRAREMSPIVFRDQRPMIPAIREPSRTPSKFERDLARTSSFTMEGDVTDWAHQPGTQVARLSVQDPEMNAAMNGSGQTNVNLSIPVDVAAYILPRSRVRVTIEVLP